MANSAAADVLAAMVAMFASGDASLASEVVSPDYVDHQGMGDGPLHGIEGFVRVVRAHHGAYEHQTVEIEDLFGIDDRAVARIRWCGRRRDGEEVDRETIDIVRVVDGQAVAHWGA